MVLSVIPGRAPVIRQGKHAWIGRVVMLAALFFLLFVFVTVSDHGRLMPYIPQFLNSSGIGPNDVPGGRVRLVTWDEAWIWITVASAFGTLVAGSWVYRRVGERRAGGPGVIGLVAWIAAWQFIGTIPPSYQYIARGGSLDRYLLPLVPLAIVIALWATRDVPLVQPVAWIGIALFAVVSTAGVRDYLTYLGAVWEMAEEANAAGVTNDHLDAGSGWDGYYLYQEMIDQNITKSRSPRGSPWWVYFYAKPTDSTYVISTDPEFGDGYEVVEKRAYSQWLEDDTVYIYLLKKKDSPWPPAPDGS